MYKKYDWKKTLNKFSHNLIVVLLSGLMVVWQEDPRYMILIPLIKAGLNWYKHK